MKKKVKNLAKRHQRACVKVRSLLESNRSFKTEVATLRRQQAGCGIAQQRKGKGPRAHLTDNAKVLTMASITAANMGACKWKALTVALSKHLGGGPDLDLRGCHDRTARRLLALRDMIWLARETRAIQAAKSKKNLQFMCDISPLLGSKYC